MCDKTGPDIWTSPPYRKGRFHHLRPSLTNIGYGLVISNDVPMYTSFSVLILCRYTGIKLWLSIMDENWPSRIVFQCHTFCSISCWHCKLSVRNNSPKRCMWNHPLMTCIGSFIFFVHFSEQKLFAVTLYKNMENSLKF